MNTKKNTNSLDTDSVNPEITEPQTEQQVKSAPTNGQAKVVHRESTTTVYNQKVGTTKAKAEDEEEEEFYDPLAFLNDIEGDSDWPLTMTITRNRDERGVLLPREKQECVGQFDVDPPNWRRDVRMLVPDGGYFLVVFRWNCIGPGGQPRGSLAAKEPIHYTALKNPPPLPGQTAIPVLPGQPVDMAAMEMAILQKMKVYKDIFGGGGGGNSLTEAITLLNSLGLIKKPGDDGNSKSLIEQVTELKELFSIVGGGKTGWDVVTDLANSEVVAETVAMVPDLVNAFIAKNKPTEPAEKPKHDAEAEALPEHELSEAIDVDPPLPAPERVQMPPEQAKLYNTMIERAIQDLMTNSPVDSTALLCEQYFTKYPVDSMELIKQFVAGEEAALQFLAAHTTDAELQKNLLALPTGKDWIKRLREKLIPG